LTVEFHAIDADGEEYVFDIEAEFFGRESSIYDWNESPSLPETDATDLDSAELEKILSALASVQSFLMEPPGDSADEIPEMSDLWITIGGNGTALIVNATDGQVMQAE
jgi:hypothetical protein